MSESVETGKSHDTTRDKARRGLEQAEVGEVAGVEQLDEADAADPQDTEAVEQEASDGPGEAGLAR